MRRERKTSLFVIAALGVLVLGVTPVYAASRTKISNIRLEVKDQLQPGSVLDEEEELEITTSSNQYSVDEWEVQNEGFTWGLEDVPEIEVTLITEDDYYFSVSKDKVKVKGAEATVSSVKKEDAQELHITLKLKPMSQRVGAIEYAYLNGTNATWAAAEGAATYEVTLYRNDKTVGTKQYTTETALDFGIALNREGEYYYRVRGIGSDSTWTGSYTESPSLYRSKEEVAAALAGGGESASAEQGGQETQGTQGRWVQTGNGWRFFKTDGTQQYNDWLLINGKWYFFQEDGLMKTGWVNWKDTAYYLGPDGDMWVNRDTPDGHFVNESGAAIR